MEKLLPRVFSFRKAKNPKNGVLYYGIVESRSGRENYTVTAVETKNGLDFRCSCKASMFAPQKTCIHVQAVLSAALRIGM